MSSLNARAELQNVIIRASAGAGKTYQLSNRFLAILFADVPPDHILATTFARKAAGEIRERVLFRLAEAAVDHRRCSQLGAEIARPRLSQTQCRRRLRELLHELFRLRIGTLDSFFANLCRNFSLELRLPPDWRIVEEPDDARLRDDAIHIVLRRGDATELTAILRNLDPDESRRSVGDQIREVVEKLHNLYRETKKAAWHPFAKSPGVPLDHGPLADAIARLDHRFDFGHKNTDAAHARSVQHAKTGRWEDFIAGGIVKRLVAHQRTYNQKPIPELCAEAYEPLIAHARAILIGRLSARTAATWDLLDRFDCALVEKTRQEKVLRFDDLAHELARHFVESDVSATFFRLDSRIEHLLLDEFQDTSLLQWRAIRKYARNAAEGAGRSFFCVGDWKQAVYGWRGGDAEIFDKIADQVPILATQSLDTSQRSSAVVIETVNRVFENLEAYDVLRDYDKVKSQWRNRFTRHTTAKSMLAGYCRYETAPDPSNPLDKPAIAHAARLGAEIHGHCPDRSIGILLRSNKYIDSILFTLREEYGIEASGEGRGTLRDSAAVLAVRALLLLADHPGHTIARFHVARSPLGVLLGWTDYADDAAASRLSAQIRDRLAAHGFGPSVTQWSRQLATSCDAREARRLVQLVELAYRHDETGGSRPMEFVDLLDATEREDPTASRVRVMTIHKSKGLEFDAVILPELDVELTGKEPMIVVDRPTPFEPIRRVCRYVKKDVRPILPDDVQAMFAEHDARTVSESLCLLYVAMTRAVHALYLLANVPKRNKKTYARLLKNALAAENDFEPGRILFELGDADWYKRPADAVRKPVAAEAPTLVEVRLKPTVRRRRELRPTSPSGMERGRKVHATDLLRLDQKRATDRGTLWHAWLKDIEWIETGLPDDGRLNEIAARQEFELDDLDRQRREFKNCIAKREVRLSLTRARYRDLRNIGLRDATCQRLGQSNPEPLREHPFAMREDDAIVRGAIDRLVLFKDAGGVPLAAEIIDFKTDLVHSAVDIDTRVANYREQLLAYQRAVARSFAIPAADIVALLVFLIPGIVRSIGDAQS